MATLPLYILVQYGDATDASNDLENLLEEAHERLDEHLSVFGGPRPFRVSPDDIHTFDLQVFKITDEAKVVLPFQEWVDEYYQARETELLSAEEAEYQRYLNLRTKWEARRLADEAQTPPEEDTSDS